MLKVRSYRQRKFKKALFEKNEHEYDLVIADEYNNNYLKNAKQSIRISEFQKECKI